MRDGARTQPQGRPEPAGTWPRLLSRCSACFRYIWPWQRYGYLVVALGVIRWHAQCRRLVQSRLVKLRSSMHAGKTA